MLFRHNFILLLALISGTAFPPFGCSGSPASRCNRALIAAYSKRRLIEARLSGGVRAGRYIADEKAGSDRRDVDEASVTTAYDVITEPALSGVNVEAQIAYARLLAADNKSREALLQIKKSADRFPLSAEVSNDIGACLFALGRFEEALDKFEEALSYNSTMPEALFNRALCYQRLLLRNAAAQEFGGIENTERDSGWLAEIRQRKEEASKPLEETPSKAQVIREFRAAVDANDVTKKKEIVEHNFDAIYRHCIGGLSVQYLKSPSAGQPELDKHAPSSEMETIGQLVVEVKGDRIVLDEYYYLSSLSPTERQIELGLLEEYGKAMQGAQSRNGAEEVKRSIEKLRELARVFQERGNYAISSAARIPVITAEFQRNEFEASMNDLREFQTLVERFQWPGQRGWAYSQESNTLSRMGRDSLAVDFGDRALEILSKMHEPARASKALQYLGIAYWRLGDLDAALAKFRKAILLLNESGPRSYLVDLGVNYLNIADIYRLRANHKLALLFSEEALGYSQEARDNRRIIQASSFVAAERGWLEQFEEAADAFKTAREALDKMAADKGASLSEALLFTRAGEVASRKGDWDRALRDYAAAEKAAHDAKDPRTLLTLLRSRAEQYLTKGLNREARADISRAANEVAQYREGISDKASRGSFLDLTHGVFDQLVSLNLRENLPQEAFNASERGRGMALLDELSVKKEPALNFSEVKEWLPANMTLVEYSVTSEGSHIFVVNRDGFCVRESATTTERLDSLVDRYVSDLRERASLASLTSQARVLYDLLIKPIAADLDSNKTICIVPDKALNFLPFAALVDGSGDYLIKSKRLVYAPSASVLVQCLKRDQKLKREGPERMLAVGNPAFDRALFPKLGRLEDSEREAAQSGKLYSQSVVLTDVRATEARVVEEMKTSDVVHIASHTVVQSGSPWLAAMLLAPSDTQARQRSKDDSLGLGAGARNPDDGLLLLNEIYGLKLPRTRLVVLSSCQSALGRYYRGEGVVSLVRPFIAAGAPQVVASLWAVDSGATKTLMIAFHKSRTTEKAGPGDALRKAQLEMLGKEELLHPYYWAGFIAVGGNY